MSTSHSHFKSLALTSAALAAVAAGTARAGEAPAPAAAPPQAVEEIVITALKRSTNLQDTPMSVAAISGDTIRQTGVTGVQDYFRQVPNVNLSPGPLGGTRISIRGVQTGGEATTGLYYDETPVTGPAGTTQDPGNNAADLNLFDVDRIEVLRGPQGTLFGSGSMGGTIRVIYNKPDVTRYAGAVEGQYSTTESGGQGYFIKGMVNIPLIQDKLAFRVIGYDEQRAGFIDNVKLGEKNTNSSNSQGFHASLLYSPTDTLTLTATAIYQKTAAPDQEGWYAKLGDYKTNSAVKLPFDSTLRLYNVTAKWKSPIGDVVATSSHYTYDILRTIDFTGTLSALSQSGALCALYNGINTACSPSQQAAFSSYAASRLPAIGYQPATLATWTNELRLTGSRGPFQWTGGVYYEDRKDHIDSYVVLADTATGVAIQPLDITSQRYLDTKTTQTAFFGEVSYSPIERLTFTVGTRHFNYDKTTDGAVVKANIATALFPTPYSSVSSHAQGWVTKVNVSYKVTSDVMAYVTYSEGFRPGGANNIPGLAAGLVTYQPDSVKNYEGGLKTAWFDRRLLVDAAAFLIKWNNLQTSAVTANGLYSFLTNAGKAEIPGAEIEVTARPTHGLTLTAGGGYADAHLTQNQVNVLVTGTGSSGVVGDPFPGVPRYTGSASAAYSWPLTNAVNGLVRADYAYTGPRQSQFRSSYVYDENYGGFSSVNLRAGVEGDAWGAYVFVQNATGSKGILTAYSTVGIKRQLFTITPRTIGVNVRKSF
jgi:iron complex outermembrane recepter protein